MENTSAMERLLKKDTTPSGLYLLSFSEIWDRFSYYGLQALLVLYVTQALSFTENKAYELYGAFTALSFAITVIGGILADYFLGFHRAIIIGAILMIAANICLIFPGENMLYIGLALMVCGIGLFKPNNASLVGTLYKKGDSRCEAGFSIFYLSMNLGGLLGPVLYGYTATQYGWHYGFAVSATGMLIAFILLCRKIKKFGKPVTTKVGNKRLILGLSLYHLFYVMLLVLIILFTALLQYPEIFGHFLSLLGILSITLFFLFIVKSPKKDRSPLLGLGILYFFCIFFFACSLQTATSLTIFIENFVKRTILGVEIPTIMFLSLQPFFIILMASPVGRFWTYLHQRNLNPSPAAKIGIGLLFAVISFFIFAFAALHCQESYVGLGSVVIANFFLGLGELCVLPVAISAITQWAPAKFKGTMMGLFFLALAFSGYLAGLLAKVVNAESHGKTVDYTPAFLEIGYITLAISLVMFCLIPLFQRLLPSK